MIAYVTDSFILKKSISISERKGLSGMDCELIIVQSGQTEKVALEAAMKVMNVLNDYRCEESVSMILDVSPSIAAVIGMYLKNHPMEVRFLQKDDSAKVICTNRTLM